MLTVMVCGGGGGGGSVLQRWEVFRVCVGERWVGERRVGERRVSGQERLFPAAAHLQEGRKRMRFQNKPNIPAADASAGPGSAGRPPRPTVDVSEAPPDT